jgi:hypothetical protein
VLCYGSAFAPPGYEGGAPSMMPRALDLDLAIEVVISVPIWYLVLRVASRGGILDLLSAHITITRWP